MLKCGQKDNTKYSFGIKKSQIEEEKIETYLFCFSCGKKINKNTNFCPSCGEKVK